MILKYLKKTGKIETTNSDTIFIQDSELVIDKVGIYQKSEGGYANIRTASGESTGATITLNSGILDSISSSQANISLEGTNDKVFINGGFIILISLCSMIYSMCCSFVI